MKVLVGCRYARLATSIAAGLDDERIVVEHISDISPLLACASEQRCNLIILSHDLPGVLLLEICRELREASQCVPLLLLLGEGGVGDRIRALECGADDCLTEPFDFLELIARIKALLRRSLHDPTRTLVEQQIGAGGLTIDVEKRDVTVTGNRISLTEKEFDILLFLSRNPGRVYSREQLLHFLWGDFYRGYEHTVNSHINRLRAKIEPRPSSPRFIQTVWGVGYRFLDPNSVQRLAAD